MGTISITCTFKVAFYDGTSIIEQVANVGSWTDSTNTAPVDCQGVRGTVMDAYRITPTVTFATAPARCEILPEPAPQPCQPSRQIMATAAVAPRSLVVRALPA